MRARREPWLRRLSMSERRKERRAGNSVTKRRRRRLLHDTRLTAEPNVRWTRRPPHVRRCRRKIKLRVANKWTDGSVRSFPPRHMATKRELIKQIGERRRPSDQQRRSVESSEFGIACRPIFVFRLPSSDVGTVSCRSASQTLGTTSLLSTLNFHLFTASRSTN